MAKRKIETSKKVLAAVLIVCFAMAGVVLYGWLRYDRTDAAGLAGVILAPAATAIGFYEWKARRENEIKLKSYFGKDDKHDL